MSKAVLVLDMPKDCLHCELRMCIHIGKKYYQHCGLDASGYCLENFFKEEDLKDGFRSEHCPLRPLPEERYFCTGEVSEYDNGWNDCLLELAKMGGK